MAGFSYPEATWGPRSCPLAAAGESADSARAAPIGPGAAGRQAARRGAGARPLDALLVRGGRLRRAGRGVDARDCPGERLHAAVDALRTRADRSARAPLR